MKKYIQNNDHEPGTWKGLETPVGRKASFTCPQCKQTSALIAHDIDDEGKVQPSLVCPSKACTFHEFVQLEGWKKSQDPVSTMDAKY